MLFPSSIFYIVVFVIGKRFGLAGEFEPVAIPVIALADKSAANDTQASHHAGSLN